MESNKNTTTVIYLNVYGKQPVQVHMIHATNRNENMQRKRKQVKVVVKKVTQHLEVCLKNGATLHSPKTLLLPRVLLILAVVLVILVILARLLLQVICF